MPYHNKFLFQECLTKKKGLKEAVAKAMNNFTCSVFAGRNQHECVTLEKEAKEFFTDANVLARILNPQSYFKTMATVAFKEVSVTYVLYITSLTPANCSR